MSPRSVTAPALALTLLSGTFLSACGAPTPSPHNEPPPITIASGETVTVRAPSPNAVASVRTAPLDLVEDDGQLLLHVDVAALRRSLLFDAAKQLIELEERKLRTAQQACGFDFLDAVDDLAVSMHSIDYEVPLVIVKMNVPAHQIMACFKHVWPRGSAQRIGDYMAWRERSSRRSLIGLAADDLVFIGAPSEVKAALQRRDTLGCPATNMRKRLDQLARGPFAIAAETTYYELASLDAYATLEGQTLTVAGTATFQDRRQRTGLQYAERAAAELSEAQQEISNELGKLIGERHPLLDQIAQMRITREGATLNASLTLNVKPSMVKGFNDLIARQQRSRLSSEAKHTIHAIARGATAAFEREVVDLHANPLNSGNTLPHQLCKSAIDVPAVIPRGVTYQPDASRDFNTGTRNEGWRCLKFALTQPHRYQYAYRQGGNYKGPARGGPNPGPNGFEASAEGDLDGDGITSLFTIVGTVDAQTGRLRKAPIFISDEFE